jgi:hypothetical protein
MTPDSRDNALAMACATAASELIKDVPVSSLEDVVIISSVSVVTITSLRSLLVAPFPHDNAIPCWAALA